MRGRYRKYLVNCHCGSGRLNLAVTSGHSPVVYRTLEDNAQWVRIVWNAKHWEKHASYRNRVLAGA